MITGRKVYISRTVCYNNIHINGVIMKICKLCRLEKTFDEFVKHKRYSDGFYCYCKECARNKNKEYKPTEEAKKKKLISRKKYRENNREIIRAQDRENYQKNPKHFKDKAREGMKKYLEISGMKRRREHFDKNPEILISRLELSAAVRSGKLKKPTECSVCNKTSKRIEGHHDDYSKPLEIVWLCVPCHRKIHRKCDHRERLSVKTSKEEATVRSTEETGREKVEVSSPPSKDGQ